MFREELGGKSITFARGVEQNARDEWQAMGSYPHLVASNPAGASVSSRGTFGSSSVTTIRKTISSRRSRSTRRAKSLQHGTQEQVSHSSFIRDMMKGLL